MKKLIAILLTPLMIATMALTALAFTYSDDIPANLGEEIFDFTGDEDNITAYNGEIGSNIYNLASGGEAYCVKMDASVMYEFEAPKDGTYSFVITYIARTGGANRGVDYAVDDPKGENRVFIDLEESDERRSVTGEIELTAGKHQFYVYAPTGMDDSSLKSCDVYNVAMFLTAEKAPETEAMPEVVETVAEMEAVVKTEAPKTFDAAIVAAIAAIVSAAGYAVAKKH